MRRRTVLLGIPATMVLGAGTAQALPRTIEAKAPVLHPEGVAWDPTRHAFLVGSLVHGTVSVVRPNGQVTTLAAVPRLGQQVVSTVGLKADPRRGRVLATYQHPFDTDEVRSGLGIFDLATGRVLHLVDLVIGPGGHKANDVAFDRAGNAYVSDATSDTIYRVDVDGHASVFAKDPRLGGNGNNGVAWHPDGYLLVGHYSQGRLFRVRHNKVDDVAVPPLVGADGIALRPDGSLLVVTNGLASSGRNAVAVVRSHDGWRSARVVREKAWPTKSPTTVTLTPFGAYVVSGNLDKLLAGELVDDFRFDRL